MRDAYVLAGARTPFTAWSRGRRGDGGRGGALAGVEVYELGAAALRGALERAQMPPARVDRLVFGNMYQDGPYGCYGARYVGRWAGLPPEIPCLTLHLSCGTGLHALIESAQDVRDGEADIVATGGADIASRLPKAVFLPSFFDRSCDMLIGRTAEILARDAGITRADMDRWTAESHRRAGAARAAGRLAEEIVPVGDVREDDAILTGDVAERLAGAKALREGEGLVTDANTHSIVDGASALVVSADGARALGKVLAWEYAAVPPEKMGLASIPAVRGVLKKLGAAAGDIDLYDINETFAGQLLLDIGELGVAEDKVNVNGGALALGHPFAGTGCRQVLALLLELRRRGLRRGIAATCVGGGQGVAVALESL
ncbi:MAG: thiolase family protein [Elusimicrobiota bacterium]